VSFAGSASIMRSTFAISACSSAASMNRCTPLIRPVALGGTSSPGRRRVRNQSLTRGAPRT
jgi:hypothetical protein